MKSTHIRLTLLAYSLSFIKSHSWLDCVDRRPDGSCGGYIRNYQGHVDQLATYKILYKDPYTSLCDPRFQTSPDIYAPGYPMAKAKAGDKLILDYLENGHVNLDRLAPDNKPHPNYFALYTTGKPYKGDLQDGSQLLLRKDIEDLNPLVKLPFDDGECSDITYFGRKGPTPCMANYKLPSNWEPGIYQIVWVWHFHRDPNAGGEEYTSCFDVEILSNDKYENHKKAYFKPYQPLGHDQPEPVAETNVKCNEKSFDSELYVCLNEGKTLCPKGSSWCKNQCFNPKDFQCCFDKFLLPTNQGCQLLANPFEKIAGLL